MRFPHALVALAAVTVLAGSGGGAGADAERSPARVVAAAAAVAPSSFMARAHGRRTGERARITISAFSASGRPLRGVRVEIRAAGAEELRRCGTTNRRGRARCTTRVAKGRPAVFASRGSLLRVPIRFARYID